MLAAIWVLVLLAISLQPARPAPVHNLHREFHLLAFGITALLIRRKPWQSVLLTIALGVIIEFLQHLIYHLPLEWWDIRDDAIGAIFAITLLWGVRASMLKEHYEKSPR